jgi:UDP-N-acetylmuramoyl-tripeptide--D-alanyl-D-alanine ligase
MQAAIDNFRRMEVAPKMAIIGKMGELGDVSHEEHQRVADLLRDAGLEDVWLVGDEFAQVATTFRRFADVEQVKAAIAHDPPRGKYILIKGSNSVKLYQLPELL